MPSRKSHTKSHHGCRQCKARRVKCDETLPQCHRCVKRQAQCSFGEDSPHGVSTPQAVSTGGGNNNHHQSSTVISSPVNILTPQHTPNAHDENKQLSVSETQSRSRETQSQTIDLEPLDLELVHYFSTRTYMTMSSRLATHIVWRDTIFQQALKHKFLMHGLMATTALHKTAVQPMSSETYADYARLALAHQNAALADYIPAVADPTEDNGVALFILSLLLNIWGFAARRLPESLNRVKMELGMRESDPQIRLRPQTPIFEFLDIITTLRGIWPVLSTTNRWIQGEVQELIRFPIENDLPPHPEDVVTAFNILAQATANYEPPAGRYDENHANTRALCLSQVERLRDISKCRSVVEWDGHILSWFIMGPPAFTTCLKQGNEMALASFAMFAAMFRCMDHHWWAKGWSYSLVSNVSDLLGPQWSHCLDWPRRQVGLQYDDAVYFHGQRN